GLDGKYYYVYHVHRSDSTVSPRKTRIVPLILKKGNDGVYNITVDKEHVIKPMWK
ncbi:beta-xylosidase, partial [Bacteroides xylanisolvens]